MSQQAKYLENIDHLTFSLQNIFKMVNEIEKERKEAIKVLKKSIQTIINDDFKSITIETLITSIEATPTNEDDRLLDLNKKILDQLHLRSEKLDEPDLTSDYIKEYVDVLFHRINIVNIGFYERLFGYIDKIFRLFAQLKAYLEPDDSESDKDKKKTDDKEPKVKRKSIMNSDKLFPKKKESKEAKKNEEEEE